MSLPARLCAVVLVLIWASPAGAEDAQPGEAITWSPDVPTAFAQARSDRKILMLCINAKRVPGREDEEPAAKGLREVVYKAPAVVGKSRAFVCVLLTPEGNSKDYGELRALGIDGNIVSPQHIFVRPDGKAILLRKEYWSYGKGEPAVKALLGLMDEALGRLERASEQPEVPSAPAAEGPAAAGAARRAWIAGMLEQVVKGNVTKRKAALDRLVRSDEAGDCSGPLIALLDEHTKDLDLVVALVRALGRDGLEAAARPLADRLGHKDASVRGNAAVSLEYIGSRDAKVVAALKRSAGKEKDESIANHVYRALGRCGVDDGKARALLLKKAGSAKSEFASYGPCIGLAYFEGDAKAARGVEKHLKRIGVPGSKRGGGSNVVKRGLLSWTLAAIGDEKSGPFVREELMAKLEHVRAFWVEGLLAFWDAVARTCEGEEGVLAGIEAGVRGFVGYAKEHDLGRYGAETRNLMDDARKGRDNSTFKPKGDGMLESN